MLEDQEGVTDLTPPPAIDQLLLRRTHLLVAAQAEHRDRDPVSQQRAPGDL
jgi:hypothetical protein